MLQRPRAIHWAMLGYLCLAWGFAFALIAVGLEAFAPLTLVTLRLLVGAIILYVIMRWQGHALPRDRQWWIYFTLLSVMGNLIPFTLIAWAQVHISSGQAGLLMALMPISTMVLAHYFVDHEQLTSRRIIGVVAGFAGVSALIGGSAGTTRAASLHEAFSPSSYRGPHEAFMRLRSPMKPGRAAKLRKLTSGPRSA